MPGSGLTWRRFGVLVDHLPLDSATVLAVEGPEAVRWAQWDDRTELAAATVDAVSILQVLIVAAAGGKPPEPVQVRRPPRPGQVAARGPHSPADGKREYPAAVAQMFGVPFDPLALPEGSDN